MAEHLTEEIWILTIQNTWGLEWKLYSGVDAQYRAETAQAEAESLYRDVQLHKYRKLVEG